jgi:hypothetical protein
LRLPDLEAAAAQNIREVNRKDGGQSASDPGPENTKVRDANPNTFQPPSTDHGEVPTFWNTFSTAHRRIQKGGWSRQVTVADFPLSKDIANVNMRLTAGGVRELHWHNAAEWALMLSGTARITALDTHRVTGKTTSKSAPKLAFNRTPVVSLWGTTPQRAGQRQRLGRIASQPVNFQTGENAAFFKNKDAVQIAVSAEDEIRQDMKSPQWIGKTFD